MNSKDIEKKLNNGCPKEYKDTLFTAITLAKEEFGEKTRDSGDKYITHALDTAYKLQLQGLDCTTVITGLLHHIDLNTHTIEYIYNNISKEVVELLNTYNKIDYVIKNTDTSYLLITRYILSFTKDLRVLLVLLANAHSNSNILESITDNETKKNLVLRNLNIHSKLAEYLGFSDIQKEITEESFRITQPDEYEYISNLYKKNGIDNKLLTKYQNHIEQTLLDLSEDIKIQSRIKSKYSTYQKAKKYIDEGHTDVIADIRDLIGFRILTKNQQQCFEVLDKLWEEGEILIDEYDDYISNPKPNGYKAMQGPMIFHKISNIPIEIQILSNEMYEYNSYGPASHIVYKESKNRYARASTKYDWIKDVYQLIQNHKRISNSVFSSPIPTEIFREEVYALTPKNRIIPLEEGDTITDFAYSVHTDIGHSMIGAKVNGKSASFDQKLVTGDTVEIITQKGKTHPKPELLKSANSDSTKLKINRAIK